MKTVRVIPVVLCCPACGATYDLAVSLVTERANTLPRWDYVIEPENCRCCLEPLDTPIMHVHLRDTATALLLAAQRGDAA